MRGPRYAATGCDPGAAPNRLGRGALAARLLKPVLETQLPTLRAPALVRLRDATMGSRRTLIPGHPSSPWNPVGASAWEERPPWGRSNGPPRRLRRITPLPRHGPRANSGPSRPCGNVTQRVSSKRASAKPTGLGKVWDQPHGEASSCLREPSGPRLHPPPGRSQTHITRMRVPGEAGGPCGSAPGRRSGRGAPAPPAAPRVRSSQSHSLGVADSAARILPGSGFK